MCTLECYIEKERRDCNQCNMDKSYRCNGEWKKTEMAKHILHGYIIIKNQEHVRLSVMLEVRIVVTLEGR